MRSLLQRLTSENLPSADGFQRRIAILLDGEIHCAPNLVAPVGTRGQITGRLTPEEVQEIAAALSTGTAATERAIAEDLCPVTPKMMTTDN